MGDTLRFQPTREMIFREKSLKEALAKIEHLRKHPKKSHKKKVL